MFGDAGCWWSGGDEGRGNFCGKALTKLMERHDLYWESVRGCGKLGFDESGVVAYYFRDVE